MAALISVDPALAPLDLSHTPVAVGVGVYQRLWLCWTLPKPEMPLDPSMIVHDRSDGERHRSECWHVEEGPVRAGSRAHATTAIVVVGLGMWGAYMRNRRGLASGSALDAGLFSTEVTGPWRMGAASSRDSPPLAEREGRPDSRGPARPEPSGGDRTARSDGRGGALRGSLPHRTVTP